ncbi:alpha/beta fold hydrolase [Clostridium sp. Marseille-Q7071]
MSTQGIGEQVVVIETGLGSLFYDWYSIAKEVSKKARVILYHREGYGNSSMAKEKFTTRRVAENLKLLLSKKGINEPVILVGHSFGGMCVLHFAKLYPEMVKSLVLVDSSPVEMYKIEDLKRQLQSIQEKYLTIKAIERLKKLGNINEEELKKEINLSVLEYNSGFTEEIQENIGKALISSKFHRAQSSELENMIDSGIEIEKLSIEMLKNMPIKSIVRDGQIEINKLIKVGIPEVEARALEDLIQELNREKLNYSSKAELIFAKGSSHNIYSNYPEIILETIDKVL